MISNNATFYQYQFRGLCLVCQVIRALTLSPPFHHFTTADPKIKVAFQVFQVAAAAASKRAVQGCHLSEVQPT